MPRVGVYPPEHRVIVFIHEPTDRVANFLARHSCPFELRAHRLEGPVTCLGPVDFAALGVELPSALGNQAIQYFMCDYSSLNLIAAWVPSQNGLFCDAPQRHSVTRFRTS